MKIEWKSKVNNKSSDDVPIQMPFIYSCDAREDAESQFSVSTKSPTSFAMATSTRDTINSDV
jgi:hypothetical protein